MVQSPRAEWLAGGGAACGAAGGGQAGVGVDAVCGGSAAGCCPTAASCGPGTSCGGATLQFGAGTTSGASEVAWIWPGLTWMVLTTNGRIGSADPLRALGTVAVEAVSMCGSGAATRVRALGSPASAIIDVVRLV